MAVDFNNNIPININYDGYDINRTYVSNGKVHTLIYNGVVVWTSENYLFSNGTLGSGISVSGASVSGGKITAGVGSGAWTDWEGEHEAEEAELVVTISGLDLTNFSKLYISSTTNQNNHYGESYCNVGIDTPHQQTFFEIPSGTGSGTSFTHTITLDVSGYTGIHSLQFYLYAYSHSSYSGYQSSANLGITEIKLYN